MKRYSSAEELKESALRVLSEATNHKKLVKYHRRRLKECLTRVQQYEKELAQLGIKLELQKKSL